MKSKDTHRYFALGALGCMLMAICTGNKMVSGSNKKKKAKAVEAVEAVEAAEAADTAEAEAM